MKLTNTTIRSLTLPHGVKERTFFDDGLAGFGVRLRAGGSARYVFQYKVGPKHRRIVLGAVGSLDLGKVRDSAKDLQAKVRLGGDPAAERAETRERAAETFGALLPPFLERQRQRLRPSSLRETTRYLVEYARPLHTLPVKLLDRRAAAGLLMDIERARGSVTANRARAALSGFCTWLVHQGFADTNVVSATAKSVENPSRSRVLNDLELIEIWLALDENQQYTAIVRLLMMLGLRREEIGSLRWSELDLQAATITLPPSRTKAGREFVVPLPTQAVAILAAQPRRGDHIFGRAGDGFQDWSGSKADLDTRIGVKDWRLHDFRRSLSTALHERFNVAPHIVECCLGHTVQGIASVYNRADYLLERRRVLQRWADHLEGLVSGKPMMEPKVVNLR
jgi:integrase